jgi:hypothetical protein
MTSPNLAITHVAAAQNQKEVTVNDAIDALDRALTEALAVDFSGGPVTLTAAQFRTAIAFKPSATLTAPASLTVPQIKRVFVVINTDGFFTIDVVRSSKTVSVPPGTAFCLCTDGTVNGLYAAGGGGSGGGASAFTDLSDTPSSYSGQQGRAVIVNAGASGVAFADLPNLGALSGRSFITGATGSISTVTTTNFATKGLAFVPAADILVTAVLGFVNASAIGQGHYAQIARLAGASADAQVLEVLAATSSTPSTATTMTCYRYPFATPVTLLSGQPYLLSLSIATGTGTTALRLMSNAAGTATMWWLNAPGTTLSGAPQYNTIGLSPGQSPTAFGTGIYGLAIEGYILDYLPAYHLTHFAAGQSASGAVVFRHVFSRAARLPAGATSSRAVAGIAATGPSVLALLKNGTSVGSVQFTAGEAVAYFVVAAAVDFAAGDVFAIAAPDPQDATLADIALTLVFGFV